MKEVSRELVKGCISGDRRSHTEMYAIVYPTLMSMSKRYFRNRDEQVTMVNNCFLKLIKSLNTYADEGVFEAWCRKLMTHTIIDGYRAGKRWNELMQLKDDWTIENNRSDAPADENHTAEQLEALLMQLPDASRCVFNLFAIEGYAHSEIATMLNISEGTSKWHVSKAREALKKMLTPAQTRLHVA